MCMWMLIWMYARWNQLPYMAQRQVGQNQGDRCQKFEFFDQYVTISYESASKYASAPSLRVENCDLHGNSIMSTPRWLWWNWLGCEHDRVTMEIVVFDTRWRDWRASTCWFIVLVQIEELELSVRNSLSRAGQLAVVPHMEFGSTWHHARDKFYQAPPFFSCNVEKIREPGDKATVNYCFSTSIYMYMDMDMLHFNSFSCTTKKLIYFYFTCLKVCSLKLYLTILAGACGLSAVNTRVSSSFSSCSVSSSWSGGLMSSLGPR